MSKPSRIGAAAPSGGYGYVKYGVDTREAHNVPRTDFKALPCPTCGAAAGMRCVSPSSGRICAIHVSRRRIVLRAGLQETHKAPETAQKPDGRASLHGYTRCPSCGAVVGLSRAPSSDSYASPPIKRGQLVVGSHKDGPVRCAGSHVRPTTPICETPEEAEA